MIKGLVISSEPYVGFVTTILFHSLWQGIVIGILAAGVLSVMRNSSANSRYIVSCLAMAAIILAVGITIVFAAIDEVSLESGASGATVEMTEIGESMKTGAVFGTQAVSGGDSSASAWWSSPWVNQGIFAFWFAGVLLFTLYHLIGWLRARDFIKRGTGPVPPEWQAQFKRLCSDLKVTRLVKLFSTSLVSVPCVVGWVKPVILLPVSMLTSLDSFEIEMILVHELAHVRRYDVLVNIIQTAIETVFFFSPAIWWLSRQIRIEREHCCDDTVVASTGDKLKYARALANLEELRMFQTSFSTAITGSPLANRIKRLVGESNPHLCSSGLSFPGMIVMVLLISVSLVTFGGSQNSVVNADTKIKTVKADTRIETAAAFSPKLGDIGGNWEFESERGNKSNRIHIYRGTSTHTEMKFKVSELLQKIDGSPAKFQFVRDAGSFIFEGEFEGEIDQPGHRLRGQGEWYFQADAEYVGSMRRFGLRANNDETIFTLALFDVTKEYVSELEDLGFRRLKVSDFVSGRVHGVTPKLIREFQDAGFGDFSFGEHLALKIFKVNPWTSREFSDLGFDDLSADDLIDIKTHGVTPERIEAYQDAVFQNLSFDDLIEMIKSEVTPSYIRAMAKLGYDDLSPRILIKLREGHVTPSLVRRLQRKGLNLTTTELLNY